MRTRGGQRSTAAGRSAFDVTRAAFGIVLTAGYITWMLMRVFFGTLEFLMTGTPYANGGRVAVRVDQVSLGGLGLPDSVRASSAAAVQEAIGRLVPSTVNVQKVSLGDGTITIEGVTQR